MPVDHQEQFVNRLLTFEYMSGGKLTLMESLTNFISDNGSNCIN